MELNVLEGAHGTKPMRLWGGQAGLENMKNTHNLFQDLWNESLGFFRKVLMQKMEPKCVQKIS